MKKVIILLFITLYSLPSFAQTGNAEELNNYAFVVIPMEYRWQDKDNEYMMNSLTKYLLNKEGFETYMEIEDLPEKYALNKCLGLVAEVVSERISMITFVTRTTFVLKDCRGNIVYETKEGTSREKNIKQAYQDALRDAFTSFEIVRYNYNDGNGYYDSERSEGELAYKNQLDKQKKNAKKEDQFTKALSETFNLDDTDYKLQQIEAGYVLIEKESGDRTAVLNKTDSRTILYNSKAVNGTARFDDGGNIVVDYFDADKGAVDQLTYTVSD